MQNHFVNILRLSPSTTRLDETFVHPDMNCVNVFSHVANNDRKEKDVDETRHVWHFYGRKTKEAVCQLEASKKSSRLFRVRISVRFLKHDLHGKAETRSRYPRKVLCHSHCSSRNVLHSMPQWGRVIKSIVCWTNIVRSEHWFLRNIFLNVKGDEENYAITTGRWVKKGLFLCQWIHKVPLEAFELPLRFHSLRLAESFFYTILLAVL